MTGLPSSAVLGAGKAGAGGAGGHGGAGGNGGTGGAGGNGLGGGDGGTASGGGIYLAAGSLTTLNTTIAKDSAQGGAAGIAGMAGSAGAAAMPGREVAQVPVGSPAGAVERTEPVDPQASRDLRRSPVDRVPPAPRGMLDRSAQRAFR